MKLRQQPSDFKVEEISEFSISKTKRDYKLFLLEKTGLETFSLIQYLSKQNNIPAYEFCVAGLKDKHAETRQHMTLPSKYDLRTLREQSFKITFLGYVDSKIKLGDLTSNKFEITVREVLKGELDGIYQKAKNISDIGVPNYFDSQRFGSAIYKEFIAKEVMLKNYEKAVKIYQTQISKSEKKFIKEDKKSILANWTDLTKAKVFNGQLRTVVDEYILTKSWLSAYKKIPGSLREIFDSAYQSYLWNECIKTIIRQNVESKAVYSVEYTLGTLLFYKRLTGKEASSIPKTFQTISDELVPHDNEKKIIEKVLTREGITISDFKIKEATGNFFKSRERQVIIKPQGFSVSNPQIDDVNDKGRENRYMIKVKFTLPKASYATIVIKRLFNQ
jgi:tRNA pseudouridine13 synthase